ncbi:MAG: JAB domain-containing protein [Clostridia bacterium]|jgi:DNA repair protein RadC|nr:JAB domain-containing protein [Clostridia bacterium]
MMNGKNEGAEKGRRVQVVRVEMVKERAVCFATNLVRTPQDAASILAGFLAGVDREHFVIMCLDTKNKVNALNVVSVGSLNAAMVHPREVFKPAILANAASIIMGHNHPSGNTTPSREDRELTGRLVEAGKLLGIEVIDSLIIGDDGNFLSFKEQGLI